MTVQHLSALATQVRNELSKVIIGQEEVVSQLLLVLVCGGHAVMEGVPGLAKTLAVKSLARVCGLGFQRVQCTADLMPADVTGTNVFNLSNSSFSLHDEINRTSPRTQAALLEAMEEHQVTMTAPATLSLKTSPCLPPKTPLNSKAPIRFPKRNSIVSSSRFA